MIRAPSENYLPTDFGELCYFEWGKVAAPEGPSNSILLLHATGFHARCWDKMVDALPDDLHIIAVDQLGHGRSTKPDSLADWRITADATQQLIEQLEIKFSLAAGHSMGGYCLSQIAAQIPYSFAQLMLIDPVIMEPNYYANNVAPESLDASDHPMAKRRANWTSPQELFDRLKSHPSYTIWQEDVLMDYCEHGLLPVADRKSYELACPPKLEASVYMGSFCDNPYPALTKIDCPVTILRAPGGKSGDKIDFTKSPTVPDLVDSFVDGQDIYLSELTHFMPMQDPKKIAKILAGLLD